MSRGSGVWTPQASGCPAEPRLNHSSMWCLNWFVLLLCLSSSLGKQKLSTSCLEGERQSIPAQSDACLFRKSPTMFNAPPCGVYSKVSAGKMDCSPTFQSYPGLMVSDFTVCHCKPQTGGMNIALQLCTLRPQVQMVGVPPHTHTPQWCPDVLLEQVGWQSRKLRKRLKLVWGREWTGYGVVLGWEEDNLGGSSAPEAPIPLTPPWTISKASLQSTWHSPKETHYLGNKMIKK